MEFPVEVGFPVKMETCMIYAKHGNGNRKSRCNSESGNVCFFICARNSHYLSMRIAANKRVFNAAVCKKNLRIRRLFKHSQQSAEATYIPVKPVQ